MIKLISIVGAFMISLSNPILSSAQTSKFPPIQSYFDQTVDQKCAGFYGLDKIISQQISEHTLTVITENSKGEKEKSVYSNLDFSKLSRITTYEEDYGTKKIMCLAFWFKYNITYTLFKNGVQYATGTGDDRFHCYILAKDEKEIVKLFKDWIK